MKKTMMKKMSVIACILLIIGQGTIAFVQSKECQKMTNNLDDDVEFWGVVIVNVEQTQEPYIYDALLRSENWIEDHLILLWKETATKQAILQSIDWLKEQSDEQDIVLFACDIHGIFDGENYGIFPFDGYTEGLITISELDQKFDEINAKNICLIFDSCYSGNFVYDATTSKSFIPEELRICEELKHAFLQDLADDNRVILMSALKDGLAGHWYSPFGSKKEISLSSCIGDALNKRIDYNSDQICTIEEAFKYAKNQIMPLALVAFFNPPLQLIMWLTYGTFIKPFPNISDPSEQEIPIIINTKT
jgi:hypothetical protein